MEFAKLLTHIRESKGLTKTDLAKKLGVSQQYITRIELGQTKPPSIELLLKMKNVFNLQREQIANFFTKAFMEKINDSGKSLTDYKRD